MCRRKEPAGRGIYIQLRQYNLGSKRTEHLKGMGLRVYDWTPAEVQAILYRTFYEEQQRLKGKPKP